MQQLNLIGEEQGTPLFSQPKGVWNPSIAWRKYQVQATSIEDFMLRYYKPDRYHGRGADYAAVLLQSHRECLRRDGVDIISHHDSVTGEVVAYYEESLS